MRILKSIGILAASLLQSVSAVADDVITNSMSPVLSYQFPNDLGNELTSGGISSPIVSYQYFEWPGNEVLHLQSSPWVSYYYIDRLPGPNVAVRGRVQDEAGAAVAGARVIVAVNLHPIAVTQTGPDGSFQIPALESGLYCIVASHPAFASAGRVLELVSELPSQDFILKQLGKSPGLNYTDEPVPLGQRPRKPRTSDAQLKVFRNSEWAFSAEVDPNKMTIVLTHGWIVCSAADGGIVGWPTRMAEQLRDAGVATRVNLLAWDWRDEADTCPLPEADKAIGPPVDRTRAQGLALGKALYETFGANYAKEIHFMGHSLGALVNAEAVNYLHGDGATPRTRPPKPWDSSRTHVTLFDEAEIAVVAGQQARLGAQAGSNFAGPLTASLPIRIAAGALGFTVAAINDWRNPIPVHSVWVDNYISLVGINHPNAVNVCLQEDSVDALANVSPVEAHGVGMKWYGATVTVPSLSTMGFANTFEQLQRLPPVGEAFSSGNLYLQRSFGSRFELRRAVDDDYTQCQQEIAKLVAKETFKELAADVKGVIRGAGDVVVDSVEWLAAHTDIKSGLFTVSEKFTSFAGFTGLRLKLRSRAGPKLMARAKPQGLPNGEMNSPAYAWMAVAIPPDAAFMIADFTVSGDGVEDSVVIGINGTNRFSLETQFVPPDVRSSSSQIDVSAFAGKKVELFFGLLGGTSVDCLLTVEGIRFLTLDSPILRFAGVQNDQFLLAWPSAAVDYVLEEATSSEAALWVPVGVRPLQTGGEYLLARPMSEEARFFRLRKP